MVAAIVAVNDVGSLKKSSSSEDSMPLSSLDVPSSIAEQHSNSQPINRSRSIEANKPSSESETEKIIVNSVETIDTKPNRAGKALSSVVPLAAADTGQNYTTMAVKDESKSKRRSKGTVKEAKPVTAIEAEMEGAAEAQASSSVDVRETRKPKSLSEQTPKTDETNATTKASKTTVIEVGNDSRPSRSGWWDRD